ncbi:hypothetical protein KKA95_00345 [Patescibacteria group bacterium]|nr:hypothetical protein [Patescibacteria group bacterium]
MKRAYFTVLLSDHHKECNPTEESEQQCVDIRKTLGNLISLCVVDGCKESERCTLVAKSIAKEMMVHVRNIKNDPKDFPKAEPMEPRSFRVVKGRITEKIES